MLCPYCQKEAEWVENKEVYGRNFGKSVMIYLCRPCNAYVGCHNNTRRALGTMANKELRDWRVKAHAVFDPLWKIKSNKILSRKEYACKIKGRRANAYHRLKEHFGKEIHIGEADVETCKNIIQFLKAEAGG